MPPVEFEPTISPGERPQTYALDRAATGIGNYQNLENINNNNNNNNNNKSVETSHGGKVTILWNQQAQTDRTNPNNKPRIIIRDNEKATCMLIDVAISGDRNVI